MKRIAAITMVRNDHFFLRKWVEYYGAQFGRENLFIYFDGLDQKIPDFCKGVNARVVDKIGNTVVSSDKGRIDFISAREKELFEEGYELVVGGDADEYLVVDPDVDDSLAHYLSEQKIDCDLSGLGLDFGQKMGEEEPLTADEPFLSRRHYAQIGTRYTKASVLSRPCDWGSGFHRVRGHNYHIGKGLYLMHFGYSDMKIIEGKLSDGDRLNQGWKRHMNKRSRTIRLVTRLKARSFDKWCALARKIETVTRKPYAWNKPGLLGLRVIVRIPDRFLKVNL